MLCILGNETKLSITRKHSDVTLFISREGSDFGYDFVLLFECIVALAYIYVYMLHIYWYRCAQILCLFKILFGLCQFVLLNVRSGLEFESCGLSVHWEL